MGAEYDPGRGGIRPHAMTSGASGPLPDSDGDGVPDVADECVGLGAFRAASGGCYGGLFFYHTLPLGGSPAVDVAPVCITIRPADVYFLMDTTGSMGGEINRLKADLTTGSFISACSGGIIGAIRCEIPDAWFGVGFFDDYPYSPHGYAGVDFVYRNTQDMSPSVAAAQAAVNALALHYGMDGPESNV